MEATSPQFPMLGSQTKRGLWQHSRHDAWLVALALGHAALLVGWPSVAVVSVGIWWNSNTISHHFIHNAFFRSRILNRGFAAFLSILLGYPHVIWRARHLAHHADRSPRHRLSTELVLQATLVLALWIALAIGAPEFMLTVYLPGFLIGMALCGIQGYYEHARGTTSHYGRLYNLLFFNDGFHAEHHRWPQRHWKDLADRLPQTRTSRWPPVLRWLDLLSLESLERLVLRRPWLQRIVLRKHHRAIASLLIDLPDIKRVGIVGGGLFPRSAIILRELLPDAFLTVIDMSDQNLAAADSMMPPGVERINERYDPDTHVDFDLLVLPLSYRGDRQSFYLHASTPSVLVHDWIWNRRGISRVISWWLLKRVNLVRYPAPVDEPCACSPSC